MHNEVLLDKLSEFLMVEQCGWQLYRVVGERATAPELQAPTRSSATRPIGTGRS